VNIIQIILKYFIKYLKNSPIIKKKGNYQIGAYGSSNGISSAVLVLKNQFVVKLITIYNCNIIKSKL
jgi:hypothetical protein